MKFKSIITFCLGILFSTLGWAGEVEAPGKLTYKTQFVRNVFGGRDYSYYKYYNWTYVDGATFHKFDAVTYSDAHGGPTPEPIGGDGLSDEFIDSNGFKLKLYIYNVNQGYVTVEEKTGFIYPKFQVLTIIYATPGQKSYVDYGASTLVGTSSTISNTFSNTISISGTLGKSVTVSGAFSYSVQKDGSIATTATKSFDQSYPGTPSYLLDHDYDLMVLLLNPQIEIFQSSPTKVNFSYTVNPQDVPPAGWDPAVMGPYQNIVKVYVGELNGHLPMRAQVKARLDRAWHTTMPDPGLDPIVDYSNILKLHPFSDAGSTPINPSAINLSRFSLLPLPDGQSYFDYLPPVVGGQPITGTLKVNYSNTSIIGTTYTDEYTVKAEVKGDAILFNGAASIQLKYTNKQTDQSTNGSSQFATVSITAPPYSNPQPVTPSDVFVYQDTRYGTYMFWGR